jgi:hypothetical protein
VDYCWLLNSELINCIDVFMAHILLYIAQAVDFINRHISLSPNRMKQGTIFSE